jgi:hypothetical protein
VTASTSRTDSQVVPWYGQPCGHSEPQASSQLHGICIFCWRDRAGAEIARLRAALAEAPTKTRRFPVMGGPSIPWWAIAPHDAQAQRNHGGQTLERLAQRGGLSPAEAMAVLEDRPYEWGSDEKCRNRLQAMVEAWDTGRDPGPACGDEDDAENAAAAFRWRNAIAAAMRLQGETLPDERRTFISRWTSQDIHDVLAILSANPPTKD